MAEYYYTRNKKVRGPIPLEQIVKYVKGRKLPMETQVCMAGKKEWKAIGTVAPDVANLASNAKIVGWTIGGAAGLILFLIGVMWLLSGGDKGVKEKSEEVATKGAGEPEPMETIVTEFTVTPGKRKIQEVKMGDELKKVLTMDVELQSPVPVQVALTPTNLYITGRGARVGDKSAKFFVAPKLAEYEMKTDSEVKNLAMGTDQLVGFDDGEMNLMLEGVKKYKISLMFFDPPGEDVVLHFPPSQPWDGTGRKIVAANGPDDEPEDGRRPAGGDIGAGEDEPTTEGGGDGKEIIVVGNVPENFAFMPLSKIKLDAPPTDIKEALAAVSDLKIEYVVKSPDEAQVKLVSGDDVVTGLYGEGIRLFPAEAGAEVTMWITEPFAAYRQGTLIAVYDPSKEKFRHPREEDGVPGKIEATAAAAPTPADGSAPAMKPEMKPEGGTPEMKPETGTTPAPAPPAAGEKPEMIEGAGAAGAAMAPEMMIEKL